MKQIYIAGSFTANLHMDVARNVRAAEEAGVKVVLLNLNAHPVIPHKIGENMVGIGTYQYWTRATLDLMTRCDAIFIFNPDDLGTSQGTLGEYNEARRLKMPIFFTIETLADWLRTGQFSPENFNF